MEATQRVRPLRNVGRKCRNAWLAKVRNGGGSANSSNVKPELAVLLGARNHSLKFQSCTNVKPVCGVQKQLRSVCWWYANARS